MKKSTVIALGWFAFAFIAILFFSSCSDDHSNSQELHSITFYFQGKDTVEITLRKGEVVDTVIFGERVQLSIKNNTPYINYLTVAPTEPIKIISTKIYQNALYPQKIAYSSDSSIEAWAIPEGDNDLVKFIAADPVNSWDGVKYHKDYLSRMQDNDTSFFDYTQIEYSSLQGVYFIDDRVGLKVTNCRMYTDLLNFSSMEQLHYNWDGVKHHGNYWGEGGPLGATVSADYISDDFDSVISAGQTIQIYSDFSGE